MTLDPLLAGMPTEAELHRRLLTTPPRRGRGWTIAFAISSGVGMRRKAIISVYIA